MMDYELPLSGRLEYAKLDSEAIRMHCLRLDTMLERVPTEVRSSKDVTTVLHESSYMSLTEDGRGEIIPVEYVVSVRASHYASGPLRRQYEVLTGSLVKRTLLTGGFIDNELYVRPDARKNEFPSGQFEEYVFLAHRDGSKSAYIESVDLSRSDAAVTEREMTLYDAQQLDRELDRTDALKIAVERDNKAADAYDYDY